MLMKITLGVSASVIALGLGCQTDHREPSVPPGSAVKPAEPVAKKPVVKASDAAQGKKPSQDPIKVAMDDIAGHEFPPTIPDTPSHQNSWELPSCLRCHETGVQGAAVVKHKGMPKILLSAKCRTCHVFIPGSKPRPKPATDSLFEENAFPPMIPASSSHKQAWWKDDCLLCHEDGLRGAPKVVHNGMPRLLLRAKCRTCHVQVRTVSAEQQGGSKRR